MSRFSLRKKRQPSSLSLASIENDPPPTRKSTLTRKASLHESPFRNPLPSLDFLSRSRRKRRKLSSSKDEDSLSVCSFNADELSHKEPSSKRVKTIRKSVVSLANLISPGKPSKGNNKLQRSSSFKESGSAASSNTATVASFKPYRPPSNTPNKKNNRRSKLWCETFDHTGLSERQVKWQEAIFELYQGERDLVQDLTMAKQTYRDSMVTLKMLSDEEVTLIFGKLGCLLPLHEELLNKLEQARGDDGRTLAIGWIFVEWFPRISSAYRDYCANQADAKYALDAAVERDARVRDFLQRCLESPFSRKLDLWSYLDLPRTRLVKYPLLLNNVLKRTPVEMDLERTNLEKVMEIIGDIIERVDETTGEQQCRYIISKLEYLDEKQRSVFVDNSRLMLCSGQLKNNRGNKMHVFLFEEAIMLTRQATRSNKVCYQVYRHPLPLRSLTVDTSEGDKLSGSFRGGILSSEKAKHSFRVRSEELNVSYTLQASEEHDRKQWVNAIQDALTKYREKHPEMCLSNTAENMSQIGRRRATYDPVQSSSSKKQAARAVLRSSSDKSNRSVASSTDKSLQEESQEEDASSTSEEVGPWRRGRSQTVNPAILASKTSSHSRKSSLSSGKNEEKKEKGRKSKNDSVKDKALDRLQHLDGDADGPPSPLRQGFKKNSLSRHFSLSGADKAKPVVTVEKEKRTNSCRRTRSLTSSPSTIKAVVSRFGSKRFTHAKPGSNNLLGSNATKPPIGPNSSPYSIRRSPSLQIPGGIHEAHSTPNLLASFQRGSIARLSASRSRSSMSENNSNSIDILRKNHCGGSAMELRSEAISQQEEEAKTRRKVRSLGPSRNVSDCETSDHVKNLDAIENPETSEQSPACEKEEPSNDEKIISEEETSSKVDSVEVVENPMEDEESPICQTEEEPENDIREKETSSEVRSADEDDTPEEEGQSPVCKKEEEPIKNIMDDCEGETSIQVKNLDVKNPNEEEPVRQIDEEPVDDIVEDLVIIPAAEKDSTSQDLEEIPHKILENVLMLDADLEDEVIETMQEENVEDVSSLPDNTDEHPDIITENPMTLINIPADDVEHLSSNDMKDEADMQCSLDVMADFIEVTSNQEVLPAQNSAGDLISFSMDGEDEKDEYPRKEEEDTAMSEEVAMNEIKMNVADEDCVDSIHEDQEDVEINDESHPAPAYDGEMEDKTEENGLSMDACESLSCADVEVPVENEERDQEAMECSSPEEEEDSPKIQESEDNNQENLGTGETLSDVDNNNIQQTEADTDKTQYGTETSELVCVKQHDNDTSLATCRTENTPGVHSNGIIVQHHILNNNLQASV